MKHQNKKKAQFPKATKADTATRQTGRYVVCAGDQGSSSKKVTYQSGSLLEPSAGVVPTVELSKRAAKKIS